MKIILTFINTILQLNDLDKIKNLLLEQKNIPELRALLFSEFLKYAHYTCVSEWNKAVRICECLSIIGWGEHEPLEALKGKFFNGNPETYFLTKNGETRFVCAVWSKRTTGYTMEAGRTSYFKSPNQLDDKNDFYHNYPTVELIENINFESQRNWIPKFPILFNRIVGNCYKNSKPVLFSIDNELQKMLNEKMKPEKYGSVINYITIYHNHSYDVVNSFPVGNINCKTNYIISTQEKKLSREEARSELKKIFSKKEIDENGFYLRNRFEYGPFRSTTGKMNIDIYFVKEFAMLNYQEQKQKFTEYVLVALNNTIEKLKKKKLVYNFDLMQQDFTQIINEWKETKLSDDIIKRAINQEDNN
jgi:hypothetical protein